MSDPGYKYVPGFLSVEAGTALFVYLRDHLDWLQLENVPRWEAWMNDFDRPYTYGKAPYARTYRPAPWDAQVRQVREMLSSMTGVHYEGCFLNRYNSEMNGLDWHADNDPGIDHSKPIAIVSLGAERAISVRSNARDWHTKYMLGPGSLLEMPAGSQHTHQHKIPHAGRPVGPRISLTFRSLLQEPA